jgi:hypothetical protein
MTLLILIASSRSAVRAAGRGGCVSDRPPPPADAVYLGRKPYAIQTEVVPVTPDCDQASRRRAIVGSTSAARIAGIAPARTPAAASTAAVAAMVAGSRGPTA